MCATNHITGWTGRQRARGALTLVQLLQACQLPLDALQRLQRLPQVLRGRSCAWPGCGPTPCQGPVVGQGLHCSPRCGGPSCHLLLLLLVLLEGMGQQAVVQ